MLIVSPKALKTRAVTRIDIGMAVNETTVARAFEQENEQDHGDDDRGLNEDSLDIADRGLDERGLPELDVRDGDPSRHRTLQIPQCGFDLAGQYHGIRRRLLLDADNDGWLAVVAGVASLDARSEIDPRDLLQQNGLIVAAGNNGIAKILDPPVSPTLRIRYSRPC